MPTVTLLNSTGTRWGTSSYGNSSSPFTLGRTADYTCKGRVGFAALNPSWYIKSIKLYMNRTDGYAGRTLKLGANADPDYADRGTVDFSLNIYAGSGTGAKSWDLTAYKAILQGYTGTWYLHFDHGSGDSSYCEWTSGTGSSAPRLVVEYEEATLSVPGGAFTIGSPSTITVGTTGSGLTHKVSYSIGASSGALNGGAAVNAGGTMSWTPATTLANEIRDGMVGTVRLKLESYLGGVLSSTILLDYPLNVPASYLPVINSGSTTFTLHNPAGDTIGVYVQGRSKAVCAINVTTSYGAPIVQYKLTIGGRTYTVPAGATPVNPFSITTDALTATGALTAVIEVTDSRGQKATLTRTSAVTVNSYFAPMVTGLSLTRALSDQSPSNEGTYIKFTLTCVFAAIANKNTKSGSIKFKASGGSYSAAISLDAAMASAGATAYSFTITGVIGSGAIGSGGYVVSVSLTDKYTAAPEVLAELPSKKILFDLHFSGEGVAIGKVATTASLFDVGLDSRFDGVVSLGESGQYGNANLFPNVGMLTDSSGWSLTTNVTRDTTRTLMGCNSAKSMQSGNASDVWRGGGGTNYACAPGDVISHSMYVWIDDYTTFGGGQLSVNTEFRNSSGSVVQYNPRSIIPNASHNGKWTRLSVDGAVAPAGTAYWAFRFYVVRNGTAWFACPKVEKGPLATEFVANVAGDVNFKGAVGFADPAAVRAALGVQSGNVATTLPSNGTRSGSVTFGTPYVNPPDVVLSLSGIAGSYDRPMKLATISVTNTGFTWELTYAASGNNACKVCWIAIGV